MTKFCAERSDCLARAAISVLATIAIALWPSLVAADDKLPPAEQILDRYVEAAGGKPAFEKLHNRVSKGTVNFGGMGMKGPFTIYQSEPNKMLLTCELAEIGRVQEGTDGEIAWSHDQMSGPRIKAGDERAEALRQGMFNAELHWRKLYKKVETLGIEDVEGKPAYRVMVTPEQGATTTTFYDKETGLVVKMLATAQTPMGPIPVETLISDYREVDGVKLPFKMVQKLLQQETTFVVEGVEHNVELARTRFDPPVEVLQIRDRAPDQPTTRPADGG